MRWSRFEPTTLHVDTQQVQESTLAYFPFPPPGRYRNLCLLSNPEEFILVDSMSPAAIAGRPDQRRDYNYDRSGHGAQCSTGAQQPLLKCLPSLRHSPAASSLNVSRGFFLNARPPYSYFAYVLQRVSPCYETTARWVDIPGPFLGNGSVNTFPQRHECNNRRAVFFYVVRAEML
jgi:hypothetical protein